MSSPLARRGYAFLLAGLSLPALSVGLTGCASHSRVDVKPPADQPPISKTDPRGRSRPDSDELGMIHRPPADLPARLKTYVDKNINGIEFVSPQRATRTRPDPSAVAMAETPASVIPRPGVNPQPAAAPAVDADPAPAGTNGQGAVAGQAHPAPAVPAPGIGEGPKFPSAIQTVSSSTQIKPTDNLASRIDQHVKDYPQDFAGHLDQQMLKWLRDEPVPQADQWGQLAPEDRELLSALCDGLTGFRLILRSDPSTLRHKKIQPLMEMAARIREQAELSIPTIALCSEVWGFGVYKPMENTFRAGQDREVLLYCEVANFASRQNANLMWETRLSEEVVLYTETGFPVWRDKKPIKPDESRNRRHDFYLLKRLTLPHTLSVGRYVMKATIIDEQARRIAENSVTINLVAQ